MSSSERLCRLAHDAADAEDPLRALETLVELRGELEAVTRARDCGSPSWPASPGEPTVGLRDLLREATRVAAARGGRWLDAGALLTAALAEPEAEDGACRLLTALDVDPAGVRARLEGLCAAPRTARRNARLHQDAA